MNNSNTFKMVMAGIIRGQIIDQIANGDTRGVTEVYGDIRNAVDQAIDATHGSMMEEYIKLSNGRDAYPSLSNDDLWAVAARNIQQRERVAFVNQDGQEVFL